MKERPILFSGPMVRAILEGRKTQTRRVLKNQPEFGVMRCPYVDGGISLCRQGGGCQCKGISCPYGQPGDRLWVRETFAEVGTCDPAILITRADYPGCVPEGYENIPSENDITWKPSIFMPRRLSRITLEIVSVRVERLNDISSLDCFDEGISSIRDADFDRKHFPTFASDFERSVTFGLKPPLGPSPQGVYRALWESINGPGSWELNPLVWVVEFQRPICPVCGTPCCLEMRGPNFHDGMSFGSKKCDYTGTPPFSDAAWAGKNQDQEDPMCEWCAGTGHPYADESYGMCECPDLSENAPSEPPREERP